MARLDADAVWDPPTLKRLRRRSKFPITEVLAPIALLFGGWSPLAADLILGWGSARSMMFEFGLLWSAGCATMFAALNLDLRQLARCAFADFEKRHILLSNGKRVPFSKIKDVDAFEEEFPYLDDNNDPKYIYRARISTGSGNPWIEFDCRMEDEACEEALQIVKECYDVEAQRKDTVERYRGETLSSQESMARAGAPTIALDESPAELSAAQMRRLMRVQYVHPPFSLPRVLLFFGPWTIFLVRSLQAHPAHPVLSVTGMLFSLGMLLFGFWWHRRRDGVFEIDPRQGTLRHRSFYDYVLRRLENTETIIRLESIDEPFIRTIDFGGPDAVDKNPKPAIRHFLVLNDEANLVLDLPKWTPSRIEEFARLLLRVRAAMRLQAGAVPQ